MSEEYSRISVIGLGYIGLPTAAMFASRRKLVIGVEVNPRIVETVNQGRIHIVEPELDIIVRASVQQGFLRATVTPEAADAFLIAVPTPIKDDHAPDLRYVHAAVESIATVLKKGDLVVLESTSPVGTTDRIAEWLASARQDLSFPQQRGEDADINIAYCPERVLPGHVVRELVENDRVVGGMTARCTERARRLYGIFVTGTLFSTNSRTAEMTKLTENAFRDVNIAFGNELSMICDIVGIDVWELIRLANRHPRVNILQPGSGVGGHCIAVDPWFIVDKSPDQARLIRTAREVNDAKPFWVIAKVRDAIHMRRKNDPALMESEITVCLLGLAFKPNIDDLRESPALRIAEILINEFKCKFRIVEPNISTLPSTLAGAESANLEDAFVDSDIVVALVFHREFSDIKNKLRHDQTVVDAVGILVPR